MEAYNIATQSIMGLITEILSFLIFGLHVDIMAVLDLLYSKCYSPPGWDLNLQ